MKAFPQKPLIEGYLKEYEADEGTTNVLRI